MYSHTCALHNLKLRFKIEYLAVFFNDASNAENDCPILDMNNRTITFSVTCVIKIDLYSVR